MKKLIIILFVNLSTAGNLIAQSPSEIANLTNAKPIAVTITSATANNANLFSLDLTSGNNVGAKSVTLTITGTWAATVSFQASQDNFTTVDALPVYQTTAGTWSTSTTANGTFTIPSRGYRYIRARVTAFTSGTVAGTAYSKINNDDIPDYNATNTTIAPLTNSSVVKAQLQDNSGNGITSTTNALDINIKSGNPTTIAVTNTGTFAVQSTLQANSGVDIGKLTANQSVNVSQINGVTPLMGNGVTGTGSQRVTIASDNTAFPVNATLQTGSAQIGHLEANQSTNIAQMNGVTVSMGSGIMGTGVQRVAIASDNDALTVKQATGTNLHVVLDNTSALAANQSVNVAQINGVTTLMGNGVSGTGSQRVTVASDNTPFAVKTDQTTHGTTDLVAADLTKIGGTTIVNGGVAGSQSIGGTVGNNVAITANPINLGAQGVSSENTAVTTARQVQLVADLVGKLIVLPYANPENFVSGAISTAMTGTTSTSLIAAPAAGLRNYITQITVSNSHATVGTDVLIQDGSGGTTLYVIPAGAVYGGATITFPTPLRQPTTATAIYAQDVTTGASVKVSASGYIGK